MKYRREILLHLPHAAKVASSSLNQTHDLVCGKSTLATGYFASGDTRVKTEHRADGGVVVVIEVHELPLISEVKFEGLRDVAESTILEALRKEEIDLQEDRVYDPVQVRAAISVIRKVLESNGQRDVDVAVRTESLTATSVVLTFVITVR